MILLRQSVFLILRDQDGTAFLIAILLMILLTLMGTFALMTINIEIQIAANEKDYLKEFYVREYKSRYTKFF